MILFFNETKHIGGAQTSVHAYKKILDKRHVRFGFIEDGINQKEMKRIFKKKYKKAFLHLYTPKFLWLVCLLKMLGIPIVLTVHGVWFLESKSQNPLQSRKRTLWSKVAQGLAFLCSDKLIVFSHYESELIEHHFNYVKNKVVIIPGGVDPKLFYPVSRSTKKRIREKLHLPEKSTIMLVLARLEKRKGIDRAIQAFSELAQSYPNSLLCIVFPTGEYTYFEVIAECFKQTAALDIGGKIHFLTGVDQREIPHFFQACDIFMMSSIELETFGLTTLEASACGCVPIGFKSGATPELLNQIDKNLVTTPIEADALAKKIESIVSLSSSERNKLQQRCVDVAKKYSWDTVGETLLKNLL